MLDSNNSTKSYHKFQKMEVIQVVVLELFPKTHFLVVVVCLVVWIHSRLGGTLVGGGSVVAVED